MPFCRNCGYEVKDTDKHCPACGSAQESAQESAQAAEGTAAETVTPIDIPVVKKASGLLNTGYLIWSILNILFCCMPLAIAALIMTVLAKDAPSAADEEKKLKTAKICNLIATIGGAVFYLFYIVLVAIGVASSM